jgi:ankyrin repeat protein
LIYRFLLVKLHMDSLATKQTPKAIKKALEALPEGKHALRETYDKAMTRIEGQSPDDRRLAERVIAWIAYRRQRLLLKDVQYALSLELDDCEELDEQNLIPEDLLISTCAGLVRVDLQSRGVSFVHYTTEEYFESIRSSRFPNTDADIAISCLTYLCLDEVSFDRQPYNMGEFVDLINNSPLVEYAANHWGNHARLFYDSVRQSPGRDPDGISTSGSSRPERLVDNTELHDANCYLDTAIQDKIQSLTSRQQHLCAAVRVLFSTSFGGLGKDASQSLKRVKKANGLNILAYFGLDNLVAKAVSDNPESFLNSHDGAFGNVLHWASLGDQESTIRLLLRQEGAGELMRAKGARDHSPLHMAVYLGRMRAIKAFMDFGEEDDSFLTGTSHDSRTLLHVAADSGAVEVVSMILSTQRGKESLLLKSGVGYTPAHLAAKSSRGRADALPLLLSAISELNIPVTVQNFKDYFGRNPLHYAVGHGFIDDVQVLFEFSLGSKFAMDRDNTGLNPVEVAIIAGHYEITKLFLDWKGGGGEGILPLTQTPFVAHALYLATTMGRTAVVELLLNYNTNNVILVDEGLTTLHCASRSGIVESVLLLLDRTTEPTFLEIRNREGRTALSEAAERGHVEVVDALIRRGADINSRDNTGKSPLHLAVQNDLETVVESLISCGADIEAEDNDEKVPLDVGVEHKSAAAVRLLLRAGASGARLGKQLHPYFDNSGSSEEGFAATTPRQQFAAFFYLKRAFGDRLPTELISYILDLSEFWIVNKRQHAELLMVTEEPAAAIVYLRSAPIVGRLLEPVKRIVFTIKSHDQGWSSDTAHHGTYDSSCTWFEAFRQEGEEELVASNKAVLKILRNVHASSKHRTHEVYWPRLAGKEAEESMGGGNLIRFHWDPDSSEAEVKTWVGDLRPGNRICVVPKAMFPGWENTVLRADMRVYTTCLKGV